MNRTLDVATSLGATLSRLASGLSVGPLGPRPEKLLELFEFEACPYCRKAREALTALDLDAMIYPCPKGGPRFREVCTCLLRPNQHRVLYRGALAA